MIVSVSVSLCATAGRTAGQPDLHPIRPSMSANAGFTMGLTFASFAARQGAKVFEHTRGGEMPSFSEVTPGSTSLRGNACPSAGSPEFALFRGCTTALHSAGASNVGFMT